MSKSLELVGLRVLDDARFAREVTHRGSCAIGSSLLTCLLAWLLGSSYQIGWVLGLVPGLLDSE